MRITTILVVGFIIWITAGIVVYLWPGLVERVNAEILRQMLGGK